MDPLRQATSDLTNEWARLLAPHFRPAGSMDLDLIDWPKAEGPSYYNQFSHFAFLQLATGEVPGATDVERARYRELALRNIEYALSITGADFHTPHFSRGREWGRHIGEWLNYYLLCSLEVMERHQLGSPDLRTRLGASVTGAVEALLVQFAAKYAKTPAEFVGNHDTWHGLLFYRAGRHFQRPAWMAYARDFFGRCVLPFQTADGYWPEGQGIVVGYALVTAQAVSLYAELSGDEAAHAALGRFFGFHEFFSLPDGTTAVVVDVRMRATRMPFLFLPPGLMGSGDGRELVRARLEAARVYFRAEGVHDNGAQSFAFFASFAEYVFNRDIRPRELSVARPATLPAARLVRGDWRGYLGWQLVPEHPSRFVLDSQNFVELWHQRAGYLVGTGGSKFMPRFSTVRRVDRGRAYIPDRATRGGDTGDKATVTLGFGSDDIVFTLALDGNGARFSAHLARPAEGNFEAGLMLAFRPGEIVQLDGTNQAIEPTALIHSNGGGKPVRSMVWRGLTWLMPEGAVVDYPIVPHNSYTQDGLPKPEDYVGRISFRVSTAGQVVAIS